jgi:NAD(P)H-hydrate epimerase
MKILTGKQIREADRATVTVEGITSLDLMERAARGITVWIAGNVDVRQPLLFCCGKGGNEGDGLAAARLLAALGYECAVFLAGSPDELTDDTRANLARLPYEVKIHDMSIEHIDLEPDAIIIDARLGVGGRIFGDVSDYREKVRSVIEWINSRSNRVIAIDMPSGMPSEPTDMPTAKTIVSTMETMPPTGETIVRAETTLTIEFPKLALLLPEWGECAGNVVVIPIGSDPEFAAAADTHYYYITADRVEKMYMPRPKFSHKGNYGHALIVGGSVTMPGAAILAAGGALRSGCGLVTAHIPKTERFALIANHPSAMLSLDNGDCFTAPPDNLERFSAIGVGPGLGRNPQTVEALKELLVKAMRGTPVRSSIPMVLDADALNIVSENHEFKRIIPPGSVLTPHPGELRRMVGEWHTEGEKLEKAGRLAREIQSVVVVKGAHSVICTPDGRFLFNSNGTPGMAKGGSGDVLTGLITGLIARGYNAETASVIGVYNHGRAGEKAARQKGVEAMNASDLADFL